MRVLHIYKDYAPVVGGIENMIRLLAEGTRAAGIDAEVLVTNTGPRTEIGLVNGVPVTKAGRLLNISSAPVSLDFYRHLARLEQGADIVHAHLPYPPGELGHLFLGRSRRFVLTYHSDIVRQRVLGAFYRPFLRTVLRRADLIAVASQAYIDSSPFLRPHADKCRVIPFGVDLREFASTATVASAAQALRAQVGPRPLVLFVGKLRHYKGVDVLLDALAQTDAHLLIIGTGMMEAAWRQRARANGLDARVTFLGEVDDAQKIAAYHAADLFVLPSTNRAEAFGIVLIEALACGLPLVSTELGTGTSFVNQHGETGFVVSPNDPVALAGAINAILTNDELRVRMREAALARARLLFSKEALVSNTIRLYQEALSTAAPAA